MGKVVVRFDSWRHPVMADILSREPGIELIQCDSADRAQAESWLARAHVYQITSTVHELPPEWLVTPRLLARCPQLLCVSTSGAGFDTVDVEACTAKGVLVVNQAGGNAVAVAELTLGMVLALSRRMVETDRRLRRERGFSRTDLMGSDIGGKTIGLIGLGHVGTRVAKLAGAFDMRVVACDPYLGEAEIIRRGAEPRSRDELLAEADVISLHCPRTAETTAMMGAEAFRRMKRGAFFVTTARGGIHDEAALADALASGHLGGAALDVWAQEPPPLAHPLLSMENVIASYHLAGVTHEARRNMAAIAAEQILDVLAGVRPPRIVNPDAWPDFVRRYEAMAGVPVSPGRAS